jgi:hypothetical protein
VLSVAAPAINPAPAPPRSAELLLDIPSDGLDKLDFLALSRCAVQATIIKRNSSLGRQAKPSQRLLLELEYLRLAAPCITHLRGSDNAALADLLAEAWQLRREQLPALIFNATLGSDEYQAFWLAAPAPGQYPRVSRKVAAAALDAINNHTRRWLGGDYQAQNRDFEILLGEVAGGNGGALLQACADRTDRSHQQLVGPVVDLEAQLATTLPQRYRRWMDERNQQLHEIISVSRHHLEQLEQTQHPCSTNRTK